MTRSLRWVGYILGSISTLIVVGLLIGWLILGDEPRAGITQALTGPYPDNRSWNWHTVAGEEIVRANELHYVIASRIAQACFPDTNLTDLISPQVTVDFLLNQQPNGEQNWDSSVAATPRTPLTNYQKAALTLSFNLSSARAELASVAAQNKRSMFAYQVCIVVLGALTTIFVSVKSMTPNAGRYSLLIGVLAVVFSAAGTAASSLSAFSSPNDAYIRAQRGLSQLRRIHNNLVYAIAMDAELCAAVDASQSDSPRVKRLNDMQAQLSEVAGSSELGGSAGSGSKSNSDTSPTSTAPH